MSHQAGFSDPEQGRLVSRVLGAGYALTVFVSAFLLFQVQPLISKYILPWFGGTPGVWTTCMLFFQLALFAGYAYAHLAAARFPAWLQALSHVLLLGVGWALLPIIPDALWKPTGDEQPIWRIVSLLTVSVGLPFFILSTTGPLLQHWFSKTHRGRSPYRLYALSNAGSLLALVTYPFAFEPNFSTTTQAWIWSWGFMVFAGLCALCALGMARNAGPVAESNPIRAGKEADPNTDPAQTSVPRPTFGRCALWFALAMIPSVLLLAMTNQVCLDVASVPFLWIVPLSLYLLSFILCFDSDRWYSMRMYVPTSYVLVGCAVAVMFKGSGVEIWKQALVNFGALFACAMVCHGELANLKPHPRHLTAFYLVISAGGAAGGLFVGLLAPAVFPLYLELHIGLAAFGLLSLYLVWRYYSLNLKDGLSRQRLPWIFRAGVTLAVVGALVVGHGLLFVSLRSEQLGNIVAAFGGGLALIGGGVTLIGLGRLLQGAGLILCSAILALGGALSYHAYYDISRAIWTSRNFYGVLRVVDINEPFKPRLRELLHGRILHGTQFQDPDRRRKPTTYYGPESGIGGILLSRPSNSPMRVGLVGLGAGTLASYGQPGDVYRFYDINPLVVQVAHEYFTYLDDCHGEVQMAMGDARLSMEREEPQHFDVLALDAFSSDAIPTHLLTVEAVEIYLKHLNPNGVLAVHISNKHFDLRPVVDALAEHFALESATVDCLKNVSQGIESASWVLLSRDLKPLVGIILKGDAAPPQPRRILWTDDNSNLFGVLRFLHPEPKQEETKEQEDKKKKTKPEDAPESKGNDAKQTGPQGSTPEK